MSEAIQQLVDEAPGASDQASLRMPALPWLAYES